MSTTPPVLEALMGRYAARARRIVASPPRAEDVRVMRHVLRSAVDVFATLNRLEWSWRRDVYRGRKPYSIDEDVAMASLYRHWLSAAEDILGVAKAFATADRPLAGIAALERRIAGAVWLKSRPTARLMDFGAISPNPRPVTFKMVPLERFIAENPKYAARLRAADQAAADQDADLTSLSEYLLSRNGR